MIGRCALLFILVVASTPQSSPAAERMGMPAIIPAPASVDLKPGHLLLPGGALIAAPDDAMVQASATWLIGLMQESRGFQLKLAKSSKDQKHPHIVYQLESIEGAQAEAYRIAISKQGIRLSGSRQGLVHATATLWQLLTAELSMADKIEIAAMEIKDAPRFRWRGLMLDSARHYQSPEFVRAFIDWMAVHKLNVLHWHLTDDQAWRLEVKQYPRLTTVGAWRVPAGRAPSKDVDAQTGKPRLYGGYYSQAQVQDIVAHGAMRGVTIVPEIGMPSHASAAIVAYPQLGVLPQAPTEISGDWGIFPNLYNVEESTFTFLENVLTEVMGLFPGRYIHIGGDEPVKGQWRESPRVQQRMRELGVANEEALHGYITRRMDRFLSARGRRLIGWDEIIEGGLSPNATVMSWRGVAGAVEAARAGHDTVLAAWPDLYLDHRQASGRHEPPGRGRVVDLQQVYSFNPFPTGITADNKAHIIGVQANIWTEHIRTEERVMHMAYPRAAALAEVAWSTADQRRWPDFLRRLVPMLARYPALGLDAASSAFVPTINVQATDASDRALVDLRNQSEFGVIRYSIDGSKPSLSSPQFHAPFEVGLPATVTAATFHRAELVGEPRRLPLTQASLWRRSSRELQLCSENLVLALEDDAPINGQRATFLVDIMAPCWIYPQVDLSAVSALSVRVGQVPFNFQIGEDRDKIKLRSPKTSAGELEVRLDHCEGELIASLPLTTALDNDAVSTLDTPLESVAGVHDLCFAFTAHRLDPMWVLDQISLLPAKPTADTDAVEP